ncbi:MAG: ATP synthase subunit I [Syntrophales bacterium]
MSEPARIMIPWIAGMALGTLYFSGLWYTVRRLPDSKNPLLSLSLSFLARVSMVLSGFYFVMGGRGDWLAAALFGFLIAREIFMRQFRHALTVRKRS